MLEKRKKRKKLKMQMNGGRRHARGREARPLTRPRAVHGQGSPHRNTREVR